MDKNISENGLRQRLILAGLKELEQHGIKDFSLRRVAFQAEVSCAAPYRHFKNKDQLILAILEYIKEDWMLLCNQISEVFLNNEKQLISELCVLGVKFWIANGNFLSVLFLIQSSTDPNHKQVLKLFDKPVIDTIVKYCNKNNIPTEKEQLLVYAIPALIYGSIMSITKNASESDNVISKMKQTIEKLL